ncbi:PilZ domain-containing protein [Aestuariicella sp. G3-2]|uniref:PilZ domain-containing protein n=1 Tax=Pseudomaricurvus albidus TaxID=2842452 RepID=UPI001C0E38FB|nr:PilZ domain-containing protein [Aestuariicella albida]MBU3070279.1 PilZ domain-containing protein [Aestuariicella albida]
MKQADKRQEYRLHRQETVFIEIDGGSYDGRQPAEILISQSLDLSANGLQLVVNEPLTPGRIHQIAIQLDDEPEAFNLVAEVKWCSENLDYQQDPDIPLWTVGLAILESDDTLLPAWKTFMARRLSSTELDD